VADVIARSRDEAVRLIDLLTKKPKAGESGWRSEFSATG
jgi:hypothetical protein